MFGMIAILLASCSANSQPKSSSTSPRIQQAKIESPSMVPVSSPPSSEAPTKNSTATPAPVESNEPAVANSNDSSKTSLPDEILLDGWKVGLPFSEAINKLPVYSKLDYVNSQYRFQAKNLVLVFTEKGVLCEIISYEMGKGLDVGLNVGDKEQTIQKILGQPKIQSTTKDEFLVYEYTYDSFNLLIFVKDGIVQIIAFQLTRTPNLSETEKISEHYDNYLAAKNSKPNDTADKQEKSNENIKVFSRTELMNLYAEANRAFTLYQQTAYGSKGNTTDEKLNILKAAFEENNFWDKGIELEDAQTSIKKEDLVWYNFIVSFMDAVDSAFAFQIEAYELMQSGTASDQQIKDMSRMADQESANANKLYKSAKGRLIP
jgi:hypothetical protein